MQVNSIRRILVVDDEHVIADTLALILRREGFEAISLCSGKAAMEAARQSPPDLAICDVVMPGISGVDLAIFLHSQCPKCNILLFCGLVDAQEILRPALERGYKFELMTKPVRPADLLEKIRQLELTSMV